MEADNGTSADNSDVEAANTATEVEASASELNDVDAEVGDYADGIDASVGATEELGEVNEVLAAGVESGEGASEETAKMAEIAVEAICAKVGISARQARIMPAMESFGSTNSRLTATKLAMEGIKETATRIWEAIKKAAIHVWNVIKNFFAGLFKSRTMLEKHLNNIKERAQKATGTPTKKTISASAKEFSIGGKATMSNIEKILADSAKLSVVSADITGLLKKSAQAALDNDVMQISLKESLRGLTMGKGWSGSTHEDGEKKGDSYGNFTKGRAIALLEDSDTIYFSVKTVEKDFAKEIDAPTKADITKVADGALATLKSLTTFDKVYKEMEAINKLLVQTTEKAIKASQNLDKATAKEGDVENKELGKMQKSVRSMNSIVAQIGSSIPGLIFGACKAAADFANAGLNNLDAEKK